MGQYSRDRKRGPLHVLGFVDWLLLNEGMRLRAKLSNTFNGQDAQSEHMRFSLTE